MDVGFAYVKTIIVGEATECTTVARCHKKEVRHSGK